ncbi:MAG: peptidylprolyl isomerase, partial [Acidimicrobiales bacterium]|nr:peptidylprolyl isomerase [Acidimicrobiales bacterium]
IQDFVIQGGDPTGTGTGGPGYQINDELPTGYELGALAMANSGPNTNGSQFFIITGPNGEGLPPQYSKFGQVVEGLDVALNVQRTPTAAGDRPITDIFIESVTIN